MNRLLKSTSVRAPSKAKSSLTNAVQDLNTAVATGVTSEIKRALRPLETMALYRSANEHEFFESGATHACVAALKKDLSLTAAVRLLAQMDQEELRADTFNIPDFKEVIGELAIQGDDSALTIMWNMSDNKELAFPIVTMPGFIPDMIKHMQRVPFDDRARAALSIVRNLTMFPESQVELLKQPRIVDVFLRLANQEGTSTKATMALANLVGKDEIKSELLRSADNKALLSIVEIAERCLKGREIELDYSTEGSYGLYEPLLSLRYLSLPQKNREILKARLVPLLPAILDQAVDTEDLASTSHAIAIISQFAFDQSTLTELKSQKSILSRLESLVASKSSVKEWEPVMHEAQGLLWTLTGGDQASNLQPQKVTVKQNQVMISYNWAHKHVALRVANMLKIHGFSVWQDVEHMRQNIMESMAQAVLESAAVIVLVSPQYKESANCQREAMLSAKRNKKIIPLLVSEGYTGDGWLELFISPLLYYDISAGDFEQTMRQIISNELNGILTNQRISIDIREPSLGKKEPLTIDDVANLIRSSPLLADLADSFVKQEMDGAALKDMVVAWNGGKLSHHEVKDWFAVRSVGQLFQLKAFLVSVYFH